VTEQDMILGTQRGDARAFEALLAAHRAMLFVLVRRWLSKLDLDDLTQAASLALWRAALRYDPAKGASFNSYASRRVRADLRRCVVAFTDDVKNRCVDRERGQRTTALHYDGVVDDEGHPLGLDPWAHTPAEQEDLVHLAEVARAVRAAVPRLSPRLREVVETRWFSDAEPLEYEETAEALGLRSKQHAHSRHKNAIKALAKDRTLRALAKEAA
jgi:RNA polymerase sigma factor (sigma-70 family)